jgi:DNA-binding transcriptional ArsR family regulator
MSRYREDINGSYLPLANYCDNCDVTMNRKPMDAKLLEDAHIFTHPVRSRIIELLAEKPMHIDALSRALDEERMLVAYHLMALQERGFVKSNYEYLVLLNQRVTALRVYTVTDKVAEVKAELKKEL